MNLLTSIYGFSVTVYIFSIVFFVYFLRNTFLRFITNPITKEKRRRGRFIRDGIAFLLGWALFFTGLAFMNLGLFLQTYRTFAVGKPIAEISVNADPSGEGFLLHIKELSQPLDKDYQPLDKEFFIRGDLWTVSGGIIRFHPTYSFLGLKPVYQITRVRGDYYMIEDERQAESENKRTYYSLIDEARERWWRWMMKNSDALPIVEISFGSSITHNAEEGSRFIVSVLPSGFSLEKKNDSSE